MCKKELLLKRLDEIGDSLKNREGALALLALGSCGLEVDRLDEYSDLDFFVICQEGYKQHYMQSLDWLTDVYPITYAFQNARDGYKVMYEDDIFCELAIFEPHELADIKGMSGRLVYSAVGFNKELCDFEPLARNEVDINHSLNEALTNLYVGLGRYHRGERLSAYHFICIYAATQVTNLITTLEESTQVSKDPFSVPRRFEGRYPKYKTLLSEIITNYDETPLAAKRILAFLDDHFDVNPFLKTRILELCEKEC
ncbi:MAG: hypothetical protein ACRCST_08075 [Turicibacter sp.]